MHPGVRCFSQIFSGRELFSHLFSHSKYGGAGEFFSVLGIDFHLKTVFRGFQKQKISPAAPQDEKKIAPVFFRSCFEDEKKNRRCFFAAVLRTRKISQVFFAALSEGLCNTVTQESNQIIIMTVFINCFEVK